MSAPHRQEPPFGRTIKYRKHGAPCRYDVAWLPAEEAAAKWVELGLKDSDF